MGNRAVICFEEQAYVQDKVTKQYKPKGKKIENYAIYLHWNGGPESIYAFLDVCNERFADRGGDTSYFAARFTETIGRFFGGNLSVGLVSVDPKVGKAIIAKKGDIVDQELSQGDNGVYVIGHVDSSFTVTRRIVDATVYNADQVEIEKAYAYADRSFAERVAAIAAANVFLAKDEEAA